MAWKKDCGLLLVATAVATCTSPTWASFQYDLRLAPGQSGEVNSHNITLDSSSPSTYTVELWGQITGDTNLSNDSYLFGYVNAESVQGNVAAFSSGGITSVALGSHMGSKYSLLGGSSNITDDGVTDWGGGSSADYKYMTLWQTGQSPGYIDGTTDAESHQVNATTWEVLLLSYTVTVGDISSYPGTTSVNLLVYPTIKNGIVTMPSQLYYQDSPRIISGQANYLDNSSSYSIVGNVTFSTFGPSPMLRLPIPL